jgi:hypothetical protein
MQAPKATCILPAFTRRDCEPRSSAKPDAIRSKLILRVVIARFRTLQTQEWFNTLQLLRAFVHFRL